MSVLIVCLVLLFVGVAYLVGKRIYQIRYNYLVPNDVIRLTYDTQRDVLFITLGDYKEIPDSKTICLQLHSVALRPGVDFQVIPHFFSRLHTDKKRLNRELPLNRDADYVYQRLVNFS